MDFSLNEDHVALKDAVRRFCDGEYPVHRRGDAPTDEIAAKRWSGMAELGLLGLPFAAEHGGSGQGAIESMFVARELGRCLDAGAWLSSVVLAGPLLAEHGTAAQRAHWLPRIARGTARLAVAASEPDARYALASVRSTARADADGWRLNGTKSLVLEGEDADALIIAARTGGHAIDAEGITLFLIDARSEGVRIRSFPTLDGRRAARIDLAEAQAGAGAVVGPPGGALPLLEAAIDRAAAAVCAEAVGAMEMLLELTAEHLKTRSQFGAPLAKFQVLQHRVADMLAMLEHARSMAYGAAMAVDAGQPAQRRRLVSAAKAFVGRAARRISQSAIQMHGAMGMTDECRVGHYAKRLLVIDHLFGDARHHTQRFIDESLAREPAGAHR